MSEEKNSRSSLLVLETSSLTTGYRALNAISRNDKVKILEALPTGDSSFCIFALAPKDEAKNAFDEAHATLDGVDAEELRDHEIIDNVDQRVLDAVYSLAKVKIHDSLLIVETETVSACLAITQALVSSHGIDVLEIKVRRTGTGGAYGFFSGSLKDCAPAAEEARTRLAQKLRVGKVELIENPNQTFRSFFEPLLES